MRKQISILIPAFNRQHFIAKAIESILQQTWNPLKIIVYDDGSQDKTVEEVEKFPEVTLLRGNPNYGVSYARNILLDKCNTRYAAWQDSDDISNIYRIKEQFNLIQTTGAPIVFCNWRFFKGKMNKEWMKAPIANPKDTSYCMGGSMFDMDQVKGIRFMEDIDMGGEDYVWIKAIHKKIGLPVSVPKTLYYVAS